MEVEKPAHVAPGRVQVGMAGDAGANPASHTGRYLRPILARVGRIAAE
jgi:hypothetical protein